MDLEKFFLKQSKEYDLICQAYHEAGHCIIALYNLFDVHAIKVLNNKRAEGCTLFIENGLRYCNNEMFYVSNLLVYQIYSAGTIAEKLFYKDICGSKHFPRVLTYGSCFDVKECAQIMKENNFAPPGKERQIFKKNTISHIENILLDNWDAIKFMVHILYQKRNLKRYEIVNILTKKSKNKDMWQKKYKQIKNNDKKINEEYFINLI